MRKLLSVFDLTPDLVGYFVKQRLLPQTGVPQAYWGCSSVSGFLSPGDNLLEIAARDKKILDEARLTHKQVGDVLDALVYHGRTNSGKIVNGLKVGIGAPTVCAQYCPFSPPGADDACSAFVPPEDACGKSNIDVSILNESTQEKISFSGLLPHLIRDHHFFEGNVPHRLSPEDIIRILKLTPDNVSEFTKLISAPAAGLFAPTAGAKAPKIGVIGFYPLGWCADAQEVIKKYTEKFYDSDVDVEARLLPYATPCDENYDPSKQSNDNLFLHFFHFGKEPDAVAWNIDDVFQGKHLTFVLPPSKIIVFGPIPRWSLQADDGKRITLLPANDNRSNP